MDHEKRRREQTMSQRETDTKNKERGIPSTTNIQQSLFRTMRIYSDRALSNTNIDNARAICLIIANLEKIMNREANPLPSAQANSPDVETTLRWQPEIVKSKLQAAFRIDELEAMIKIAEENEAKNQRNDT